MVYCEVVIGRRPLSELVSESIRKNIHEKNDFDCSFVDEIAYEN